MLERGLVTRSKNFDNSTQVIMMSCPSCNQFEFKQAFSQPTRPSEKQYRSKISRVATGAEFEGGKTPKSGIEEVGG